QPVPMASSRMTPRNLLANKVALVTASTDGSQDPLCHRGHLAQDGLHVVVSSQKQQNSAATLQGEGLSVTGTMCHVGKAEDWERLVDTAVKLHGSIDILVSTAAASTSFGSRMDITEEIWDKGWLSGIPALCSSLQSISSLDRQGKRGKNERNSPIPQVRRVRGLCWHLVFPVL
ncbi:hypothetical protein EGM_16474, partial [Macaca fascicularis]